MAFVGVLLPFYSGLPNCEKQSSPKELYKTSYFYDPDCKLNTREHAFKVRPFKGQAQFKSRAQKDL